MYLEPRARWVVHGGQGEARGRSGIWALLRCVGESQFAPVIVIVERCIQHLHLPLQLHDFRHMLSRAITLAAGCCTHNHALDFAPINSVLEHCLHHPSNTSLLYLHLRMAWLL